MEDTVETLPVLLTSHTLFLGEEDHFLAQALFDFTAQGPGEVGFRSGATLIVAPKEKQPKIR